VPEYAPPLTRGRRQDGVDLIPEGAEDRDILRQEIPPGAVNGWAGESAAPPDARHFGW